MAPPVSNRLDLSPCQIGLNGLQVYAPMQHVRAGHCIARPTRGDFTIIGREKNPYALQVKESILIRTQKPKLNNNDTSVPLHLFSS